MMTGAVIDFDQSVVGCGDTGGFQPSHALDSCEAKNEEYLH